MTARAVRAARPELTPGVRVTATYTLTQQHGPHTLRFPRAVTGPLKHVRWITPTVFEVTIAAYSDLDFVVDSRIADSIEAA